MAEPQDWFSANAPTPASAAKGGDWFASNAPASPAPTPLTMGPKWAQMINDPAAPSGPKVDIVHPFIKEHPAEAGAMALGGAMSAATGGLAAPAAAGLVGLASAGGAGLGLAAKDVATGTSAGAIENAKTMAGQAVAGAAGEGLGRVAQAVATPASRWLMDRAFNPTDRLAREFPGMSDTAIENAIAVSKGGMEKARSLLKDAKNVANGALTKAQTAGATVPLDEATAGLQTTLGKVANSSDIAGDVNILARVEREIAVGRKSTLTMTEADSLKTQLQREARQAYANARGPNGTPAMAVEAEAKKDMAASLNAAIDRIASGAGASGYGEANGIAQELIGVNRGMARATKSGPNVVRLMLRPGIGAAVGGAIGAEEGHPGLGALAGMYATTPASMSRLAILLGNPIAQQVLRQVPRPIIQALMDRWQPATADQPGGATPAK